MYLPLLITPLSLSESSWKWNEELQLLKSSLPVWLIQFIACYVKSREQIRPLELAGVGRKLIELFFKLTHSLLAEKGLLSSSTSSSSSASHTHRGVERTLLEATSWWVSKWNCIHSSSLPFSFCPAASSSEAVWGPDCLFKCPYLTRPICNVNVTPLGVALWDKYNKFDYDYYPVRTSCVCVQVGHL